jgi:hypothetical protein
MATPSSNSGTRSRDTTIYRKSFFIVDPYHDIDDTNAVNGLVIRMVEINGILAMMSTSLTAVKFSELVELDKRNLWIVLLLWYPEKHYNDLPKRWCCQIPWNNMYLEFDEDTSSIELKRGNIETPISAKKMPPGLYKHRSYIKNIFQVERKVPSNGDAIPTIDGWIQVDTKDMLEKRHERIKKEKEEKERSIAEITGNLGARRQTREAQAKTDVRVNIGIGAGKRMKYLGPDASLRDRLAADLNSVSIQKSELKDVSDRMGEIILHSRENDAAIENVAEDDEITGVEKIRIDTIRKWLLDRDLVYDLQRSRESFEAVREMMIRGNDEYTLIHQPDKREICNLLHEHPDLEARYGRIYPNGDFLYYPHDDFPDRAKPPSSIDIDTFMGDEKEEVVYLFLPIPGF